MSNARPVTYFLIAWLASMALLLSGGVATWICRLPGVTLSDFLNGRKGMTPPRMFHAHTDAMRLVRPERRRLVYALQLSGASLAAAAIIIAVALEFTTAGVGPK
jgi:uncharacterized membrane protein YccC